MLIGADYERQLRLTGTRQKLKEKFSKARNLEAESFRNLSLVESSPQPVAYEVMKKAERALILQGAMSSALRVTEELIESAADLSDYTKRNGDILHVQGLFLGDASNNPSLLEYPNFAQRALDKASQFALGSVLVEIEEGDAGLAKLCLLPENSMKLIHPQTTPTSAEPVHLFKTMIPGLSVGFSYPHMSSQQRYFIVHQQNSAIALNGGSEYRA